MVFLAMKAPDGDDMGCMLACKAISASAGPDGMRKEAGRPDSECPSGDCESAEGAEQSAFMTLRSVRARRHEEGGRRPDSEYPSGDCVSAEGAEQSAFMTLRSVRARRHEEGGRPPCRRQTNENGG